MKKKILIGSIVTIVLLSMSFLVFTACNDPAKNRDRFVIIELINPDTGEIMQYGDSILLRDQMPVAEVRIKDRDTGKYVTDDDIFYDSLENSTTTTFNGIDGTTGQWGYRWPDKIGKYEAIIDFNVKYYSTAGLKNIYVTNILTLDFFVI